MTMFTARLRARVSAIAVAAVFISCSTKCGRAVEPGGTPTTATTKQPRNVIFILVDDLRYDVFGFAGHPFVKTPHIDALARGGVHFRNAFVTTSLCSPSRASILTGRYMHRHHVIDNTVRAPKGTRYFSQDLQKAGYQTAFIGKWHMGGETDEPQPGFDHWVSFRGQGHYLSPGPNWSLKVDGKHVPQCGYITDELTDYAIEWLETARPANGGVRREEKESRKASGGRVAPAGGEQAAPAGQSKVESKPYFLYLSHKACHSEFIPAERHKQLYSDAQIAPPATQADTAENYRGKPMWVRNQRNSWHGVDFPYHSRLDVAEYYRQYLRTLAAVDDSVGRIMDWLRAHDLANDTLVIFMGDNGFLFGEHGLIDKRCSYEESIRVPLVAHCPALFKAGTKVDAVVANIDIAPSILAVCAGTEDRAAGGDVSSDAAMDGRSFIDLATGELSPNQWRKELVYEYYWEWNFPQTPTQFALRGDRYKLIEYHGIWDTDELYDLQSDPKETKNLIRDPKLQDTVRAMRNRLHNELAKTGGMEMPLGRKNGPGSTLRSRGGSPAAEFPEEVIRE
jgi:N-acetylglucosamine-6-sulfatase